MTYVVSVSYTHLDVYKRQVLGGGYKTRFAMCSAVTPYRCRYAGLVGGVGPRPLGDLSNCMYFISNCNGRIDGDPSSGGSGRLPSGSRRSNAALFVWLAALYHCVRTTVSCKLLLSTFRILKCGIVSVRIFQEKIKKME